MTLAECENLVSYVITMFAYENGQEIQGVKVKAERNDSIYNNVNGKTWECEINLKAK